MEKQGAAQPQAGPSSAARGEAGGGGGDDEDLEIILDQTSHSRASSSKGGGGGKGKSSSKKGHRSSSSASSVKSDESQLMMRPVSHLDAKVFSGHLIDAITDEVALEGLDGITFQALKIRLEKRENFLIEGFEDIASAVWNQMKICKYFKFYLLPAPRPDLVPYCWNANRDERGNAFEPLHAPEEIYLYNPIEDKKKGIRGSCVHYETRRDVTHLTKLCSYTDMIQLFGNRLVIVASQQIREKALLGLNFKKFKTLTVGQYCIMERVGRARTCGEITRGKISSACMNIPPKTLFYMRKALLKHGLILRQNVSVKFANSRCPAGVTLFHLPRFYKRIESMTSINTRTVFSWLNSSKTNSVPVETIVAKYGKHTMRALTTSFPTLLETAWQQIVVDDGESEDGNGKKKKQRTRTIRVLRLKHKDLKLQNQLIGKVLDKQTVDDGEGGVGGSSGGAAAGGSGGGGTDTGGDTQEDKEEQINIESASSYSDVQVLRPSHQYVTSTENYHLFLALMRSGVGGLTLLDISIVMSLTPLEARSAGRYLNRHNACKEGIVKISKQKAFTYILSMFHKDDLEIHLAMQEKFMCASMHLQKIRSAVENKERKRMEKQITMAKKIKARKDRKKKKKKKKKKTKESTPTVQAEDTPPTPTPTPTPEPQQLNPPGSPEIPFIPIPPIHIPSIPIPSAPVVDVEDDEGEKTEEDEGPGQEIELPKKKSHKKKSKKRSHHHHHHHHHKHHHKSDPRMVPSIKVKIPLAKPGVTIGPSLSLVNIADADTDEEDGADTPSPRSHLVAVISTQRSKAPQKSKGPTAGPSRPSTSRKEEVPVENIFTQGYLGSQYSFPRYHVSPEPDEDPTEDEGKKKEKKSQKVRRRRQKRLGDDVDLQIRNKMVRQRVDWKPAEDRFILLGFIASSLFISKYNYSKIFLYNSAQVRDLMLKKSGGKSNKTSAAIRRRVHFLLHQQPRFEEYISMASAALRDDVLYEKHIKMNMRPPQQKIYANPPLQALEDVIDYLHRKFDGKESINLDRRTGLTGIDTMLFLRQLKRSEYYWQATMFAIFCPMGDTSEKRGAFYRDWRNIEKEEDGEASSSSSSSTPPVFNMSTALTPPHVRDEDYEEETKSPQDLYMEYCHKFLKFFAKNCNLMFNNLLIFGSLNMKGFQIISFDMSTAHSNISACKRECMSDQEVRLWTARSVILDFIFSGDSSKLLDKAVIEKCKFPLERAARSLTRAKVLVHSKKTGLLAVARQNLKPFVTGLPSYSYDEMLDFLKYLDEASHVDSLACISVGILHGLVELTDYFTTAITFTDPIFSLKEDWTNLYDGIASVNLEDMGSSGKKNEDVEEKGDSNEPKVTKTAGKRKRQKSRSGGASTSRGKGGGAKAKGKKRAGLKGKRRKKSAEEDGVETEEDDGDDDEVLDEAIGDIIDDDDDDESFEDLKENENLPARDPPPEGVNVGLEEGESYVSTSNSNALRLLRIRLNQAGVNSKQFQGFVEKDFFTLNLPNLEFVCPSRTSLNCKIAGNSHPFSVDGLKDLRKGLVELVFHRVPDPPVSFKVPNMEKILGKYTILFDLINLAGPVGLSGLFLAKEFERKGLVQGLKYLLEAKLIFSVGVAHRRFVTFNNVNDWIMPIRPQSVGTGSVGHVIMRPWLTSMGGLSWITVSRLFTSLLGQIQKPAIPFDELCNVFAPTLSPVEATVLIEVLSELKYLTIYRMKTEIVTLWSKPPDPNACNIEYNAETLIDTKDVYVAISPYVTFLHSQLNQAIQKAYKKQTFIV